MRTPLKKTEYLVQLESVLKKYGYTEMYCHDSFDGTKRGGIGLVINADRNNAAALEFNSVVDPTWGMDEYDWRDMSGMTIVPLSEESLKDLGEPVYTGGEFYAIER